jgi:xylulokinase
MKYFIGVDIGTTGIRAGVYDEKFTLHGNGDGISNIRNGKKGELIQVPDDFYGETAKAVNRAVEESKIDKKQITSISFDGQMAGIMGIDKNWKAKTPYDSWLDTRCSAQVAKIKEKAGSQVIEKTGNIPSYNHGPKILWWKENELEIFRDIMSFIQPSAYVAGRLCGLQGKDAFVDWTYLHFSGLADNRNLKWDSHLTEIFEIPEEKLPRIVSPLSIIGTTRKEEAELFGLPEGVKVAAGCGDTASCFLGTGAVEQGIAVDVAGTASVFSLTTSDFVIDLSGTVYTSRSVVKDLWYTMSYINGGGLNLEWFKDNFAPDKDFNELDDSIHDLEPGSLGLIFIPHLEGRGYPNVPHMRGEWKGFTRSHTTKHFYRSILEGIGYEYAIYKEKIIESAKKDRACEVRVVGGGSKSDIWNQIKADILNSRYCTINRTDISILGQAVIAAAASGFVKDIRKTVKGIIKTENIHSPDGKKHKIYTDYIARYKRMLEEQTAL